MTSAEFLATPATYPVRLEPDDNDTILATLPDSPGATYDATEDETLEHARDLLITVVEDYMAQRRPLPTPSEGAPRVALPPSLTLEVAVYEEMLKRGTTRSARPRVRRLPVTAGAEAPALHSGRDASRRMGQSRQQIDRFFTLRHRSRADQIDAVFSALGLTVGSVQLVPTVTVPSTSKPRSAARKAPVARRKR